MLSLLLAASVLQTTILAPGMDSPKVRPRSRGVVADTVWATPVSGDAPVVDGRLVEAVWRRAAPVTDFWQFEPHPRDPATCRTEARVVYDDRALYVGMRMINPASVATLAPMLRRDDEGLSDWVFAEFDSRHDGRTAYSFGVNPSGSRVDGRWRGDGLAYEYEWNAVWQAAAAMDSLGWSAEIRIPLSQLPYRSADLSQPRVGSSWGVNFFRRCARIGEVSNSTPQFPDRTGVVSLYDILRGIDVPARKRFEVMPYVAVRGVPRAPGAGNTPKGAAVQSSLGGEARIGITSEFSLSAAVRPDFGQVEVDPSLINLTAFETFLPERRPLFNDGAELFTFGSPLFLDIRGDAFSEETPFYSRRIGRSAFGSLANEGHLEVAADFPDIVGATKVSGRTSSGWAVGVLNAITDREYGRGADTSRGALISPFTSSTVLRVARDARRGRSSVGMMATDVTRFGWRDAGRGLLPTNSRVLGIDGRHRFGGTGGEFEASGYVMQSTVRGSAEAITRIMRDAARAFQRPDARHLELDTTQQRLSGSSGEVRLAKLGGAWTGAIVLRAVTPGFESNDLGFQRNADWLLAYARFKYESLRAGRVLRRWSLGTDQVAAGWSFGRERRAALANVTYGFDLVNRAGGSVSIDRELPALATEWLRGGPALLLAARTRVSIGLHSDARKTWQLRLRAGGTRSHGPGASAFELEQALWMRASDRLEVSATPSWSRIGEDWQFVAAAAPDGGHGGPRYVVARLQQTSLSLTLRATYAMTPSATLQLYAQPFVSGAGYDRYGEVVAPRAAVSSDRVRPFAPERVHFTNNGGTVTLGGDEGAVNELSFARPDFTVRSLNATAVLRREFGAGSTAYIVLTQSRGGTDASSFTGVHEFPQLLRSNPTTSIALKVVFWTEPW